MGAENIVVAGRVYVYVAPTGTTAPVDLVTALAVAWKNVGLTTPDSLSFSTEPSFEEIQSAQSDYPVRRYQTTEAGTLSVDLLEWSSDNFKAAFGGGSISVVSAGVYKFTPPALGSRGEVAVVVEVIDGAKRFRYVFPRMQQTEGVEQQFGKGQQNTLPLRLSVLGSEVGDPWYMLTNVASFSS